MGRAITSFTEATCAPEQAITAQDKELLKTLIGAPNTTYDTVLVALLKMVGKTEKKLNPHSDMLSDRNAGQLLKFLNHKDVTYRHLIPLLTCWEAASASRHVPIDGPLPSEQNLKSTLHAMMKAIQPLVSRRICPASTPASCPATM